MSCAVPLTGIAVFVIASLVTLSGQLAAVYASSDIAMAPYVSELWLRAPAGSELLMGHSPFYVGLWIFKLLHLLPDFHMTWGLAPWVLSGGAALAVAWAVFKVAGRVAALLAAAVLICAGTALLPLQLAWGGHGLAYVNIMLLGAFVVWLSCARPSPPVLWTTVLLLTAVTAAGVATDKLVIVGGLAPFLMTTVPVVRHAQRAGTRHVAGAVLAVGGGSIAGAVLVRAAMRSERLSGTGFPIKTATISSIPSHVLLMTQGLFSLLSGYLHESASARFSPRGLLGYACAAAVAFLIVLAAAEAAEPLRRLRSTFALHSRESFDAAGAVRNISIAFWVSSAVIVSVIYVGTTLPFELSSRRYLVTVAYAAVLLGISRGAGARAGRRLRMVTVAAVTILLVASITGLLDRSLAKLQATSPSVAMARQVDRLVVQNHVGVVYAGYWDSYALGWLGVRFVRIEPVFTYRGELVSGVGSGAGFGGVISPRAADHARRALLILDGVLDPRDGMSGVDLSRLGIPAKRIRLDRGRLNAYLYDYDIATRFYG